MIDTNVIVYAHDPRNRTKQRLAIEILEHLATSRLAALSVQVLAEFLAATRAKLRDQLTLDQAVVQVERLLQTFTVLDLTPMVVLEAARGARDHQMHYWDAQLWATAKLNQIPVLLSEDFTDGQGLEGVTFVNPFKAGFNITSLAARPHPG